MATQGGLVIGLQALALWVPYLAGWSAIRRGLPDRLPRPTPTAIAIWLLVTLPSAYGLLVPEIYARLSRDVDRINDGEWWRLVTANVVQDGGWVGAIFNITTLAVTLCLVGALVSGPILIAAFTTFGIAANLMVALLLPHNGGGNSMATMAVILCVAAATTVRQRRWRAGLPALGLAAAAGATLLLVRDGHGIAILLGLVSGCLVGASGWLHSSLSREA